MNETQRNHYSFVNQTDIVVVSASDDKTNTNQGNYTRFQVINSAPMLEAKACAIVRATIPLGKQQLPDCCVFYYHRTPSAGSRSASTVKAIRFLPFGRVVASATNYAVNRYISSYSDLVSLLNQAAANDDTTTNPLFVANDVSFTLTANKQITTGMTGLTVTYTYAPAAYDDPYVAAAIAATPITFPGNAADKNNNVTVLQYEAPHFAFLTKLPDTVYSVTLEMRDDFNQPFFLPDNNIAAVELQFKY